ncbi:hypothetical protein DFJ74DRAFT_655159 [Hyaloraphidium curvatum]|nr:hypothetical protein DFJ74DRAFT_655159 [Hyaloraphidium curvatum]
MSVDVAPSPSPPIVDDANEPDDDAPTPAEEDKSPEILRLEAVGDAFAEVLRDPRVAAGYMRWFRGQCRDHVLANDAPPGVVQCERACEALGLGQSRTYIRVPEDYYSFDVTYRRFILRSPSDDHLCKTVVFHNKAYRPASDLDELDPRYPKYIAVIVQYTGAVATGKLIDFVRVLGGDSRPKKAYNFRLAPAGEALRLTGFAHNEVAPVGMRSPVPLIMSKAITELVPPMFYVGAGHKDWKLAFPCQEFIERTGCHVADLS